MADTENRKTRVWVVDDEQVIASTIAIILNKHGFEAKAFFSAEAALEWFLLETPHILLSDIVLTGMSGVDLAIQVREADADCRILLFSGHIDTTVLLEKAKQHGYEFEVHIKPIFPERLVELLAVSVPPHN